MIHCDKCKLLYRQAKVDFIYFSVEKPVPQFKTKTQENKKKNKTRSKFSRQNLHTESAIYSPQAFVFLLSKGKIPIGPAVLLVGEG